MIFDNIFHPIAKYYLLSSCNQVKFSLTNAWMNTPDPVFCYDKILILIPLEQEVEDVLYSIHLLLK